LVFILLNILLQYLGDPDKGGRLRWNLGQVHVLKIPIASLSDKRYQIEVLVEIILAVKQGNPAADVSELQEKIDEIVWGLYGLGNEDRKLTIEG
jgi:hypothetical protein